MGEHHGVSTSAMTAAARGGSHTGTTTMTTRPKIKIIHIIAPEIIKTDVANFQDLVQRLTGKPVPCAGAAVGMATTTTSPPVKEEEEKKETMTRKRPAPAAVTLTPTETCDFAAQQEPSKKRPKIKCEVKVEEGGFGDYYDLADRSSDLWMDFNPGSFLSFLEEEADVFKGLAAADDFLLPLGSSRMDLVGEMYAS